MTETSTKSPPRSTSSLWRSNSEKGRAAMFTTAKIVDQTPPMLGKNDMMITKSKKNDEKLIAAA